MVRRVTISYNNASKMIDEICAFCAPFYRTPLRPTDAEMAKAIFEAFPQASLDDIIIARDMVYRGWQPRAVA